MVDRHMILVNANTNIDLEDVLEYRNTEYEPNDPRVRQLAPDVVSAETPSVDSAASTDASSVDGTPPPKVRRKTTTKPRPARPAQPVTKVVSTEIVDVDGIPTTVIKRKAITISRSARVRQGRTNRFRVYVLRRLNEDIGRLTPNAANREVAYRKAVAILRELGLRPGHMSSHATAITELYFIPTNEEVAILRRAATTGIVIRDVVVNAPKREAWWNWSTAPNRFPAGGT